MLPLFTALTDLPVHRLNEAKGFFSVLQSSVIRFCGSEFISGGNPGNNTANWPMSSWHWATYCCTIVLPNNRQWEGLIKEAFPFYCVDW